MGKGEGEGKAFARPITRPGVDKLTVDCGIQDGASSGNQEGTLLFISLY